MSDWVSYQHGDRPWRQIPPLPVAIQFSVGFPRNQKRQRIRQGARCHVGSTDFHAVALLFWLGLRGFIGALFWLVLPVTLLALGHAPIAISPLFGFAGALWLAITVVYLPIMQARFAAENRFWALFEWREARFVYGRAPWCISLALIVALLSAIPLYLLKIEAVPAEAIWLPSLVFMAFMFPARIIMGWAISQTRTRIEPRHWFSGGLGGCQSFRRLCSTFSLCSLANILAGMAFLACTSSMRSSCRYRFSASDLRLPFAIL